MKRELSRMMQTAGYNLQWLDGAVPASGVAAPLVVLELRGACEVPDGFQPGEAVHDLDSLASTPVSDGRLLPFSVLQCGKLTNFLGPQIASEARARRDWLYGRGMARLAAHEFYHLLTGSLGHSRDGISKACFSANDLLTEHFTFERDVLTRLERLAAETEAATTLSTESATGR